MVELGDDLTVSIALVSVLLLVSMWKDLLDKGGVIAALVVGLTISLLGALDMAGGSHDLPNCRLLRDQMEV